MKKVLLLLILALGLSLRVTGADWGFPLLLHPDEHDIAGVPAEMAERSSFDPGVYMRPDHIEIYANAVIYHAASLIRFGRPLGETFDAHKTFYYLLSRILVALLGTASIAIAYLIGKEYGEGPGLASALIFAVFPPYVGHSHYITSDVPLTLCILCSVLFALRYLKQPTNRNLMLMSLSSACAVSVKYPGVLTVFLTITVIMCSHYPKRRKTFIELSKACLAFLFLAFILSPFLFINYQKAAAAILFEARPAHLGAEGLGWAGNMLYYAKSYFLFSGIPMLIFFIIGGFYIIRNEKQYSIPLFFGFLYWVLLSIVPLHWERWALPMYNAPLLITAYGINVITHFGLSFKRGYIGLSSLPITAGSLTALACNLAFIFVIFKLLVVSTVITGMFTLKDTRNAAYDFVKEKGITQENALYEGYTPFSPGQPRVLFKKRTDIIENKRFIVLSSHTYGRFLNDKERYSAQNRFYNQLFSLDLIKEFSPVSDDNFADLSFWANRDLIKGLKFLSDYLRGENGLLQGPTIRIYSFNNQLLRK